MKVWRRMTCLILAGVCTMPAAKARELLTRSDLVLPAVQTDAPWRGAPWTWTLAGGALLALAVAAQMARIRSLERKEQHLQGTVEQLGHGVISPLNAILGLSELLCLRGVTPEQRRDLEAIRRHGKQTLALVDALLGSAPPVASSFPEETVTDTEVIGLEPGQPEYRILVVQDERDDGEVLERMLQHAGFRVRTVNSPSDGIDAFAAWNPQFIWMNTGVNGLDAIRRIRSMATGADVKIAAFSETSASRWNGEVLVAGLDDLLGRPYRAAEIFRCIARHLPVRYVYRTATPGTPHSEGLRPEALARLPEGFREHLSDAVISLDAARIEAAVWRVAELDFELARDLARCTERYAYTEIFHALEAAARH